MSLVPENFNTLFLGFIALSPLKVIGAQNEGTTLLKNRKIVRKVKTDQEKLDFMGYRKLI